ncbi:beta-1,3-galactosyltransferase 2-like [Protopterus annectens]|uniref:beta-1,3-galactosyltransferase 2-like n=1 Tax=Protopterus annectens TaxID=7888 RepID=UPI001CF9C04F|nr:beta-1,3-galactosyltransferase 2-like [Protopterus annectens]
MLLSTKTIKFVFVLTVVFCFIYIVLFKQHLITTYHASGTLLSSSLYQPTNRAKQQMRTNVSFSYPLDLVFPYKYNFTLNAEDKCKHKSPFLVLLIETRPVEIVNRNTIRRTWANESLIKGISILRLFLLGIPANIKSALQAKIEEESVLFQDLIQQDFLDTYTNLTIKTMMGFEWVTNFCPNASYIMKTDSDMFINTKFLVEFLNPGKPVKPNYFTGKLLKRNFPSRNKTDKWYIPYELYADKYFPPYCIGAGYIFSGDLAKKIYETAQVIKPLNLEDVFVGICLQKLGINITVSSSLLFKKFKNDYNKCKYLNLIYVHGITPEKLLQIWPDVLTAYEKCPRMRAYSTYNYTSIHRETNKLTNKKIHV